MKKLNFDHIPKAPDTTLPEHQYEHWVHLTAKLIKRPYIATHGLVKGWSLAKIIERYQLCTKHAGQMPGDIKWWWLRRKDLEANQ